jgi:chromosomal replication initiator protein
MTESNTIWNNTLKIISNEITVVSFNTWIKTLEPIAIDDNVFILKTPNTFNKDILESRYSDLITNSLYQSTNKSYKLKIITDQNTAIYADKTKKLREKENYSDFETFPQLNPKYIFEEFVIGNSNRFAHAASLAVAESPAKAYNPLFIYGGVGLGKTHLMHAIGHYILNQNPNTKILYVSSENFTNDLINSIKDDKNEEFRNKYRNLDVLLIDDIQFIAGKERTQEEFFHTFNALHQSNKQIVISSDRTPKEIKTLEDRLCSRFEWGLITDMQAPDFETRIAILRKKAETDDIIIPNDVFDFIAKKMKSNIRELEGALTRVIAFSSLTNSEINIDLAKEALKEIITSSGPIKVTSSLIKEIIANSYNVTIEDLSSPKRMRIISYPRQIAMYLCRELTNLSLPKIGQEFGGRDHTTVIHAYDKISNEIKESEDFKNTITNLKNKIKGD